MRLRTILRRLDADFMLKVRPKLKAWGYPMPLKNREVREILKDREERKEILKVIREALQ